MNRKTELKMQEDWLRTHKVTTIKPQEYHNSKIIIKKPQERDIIFMPRNICDFEDCPWYDSKSISAKEFKCRMCKIKFDF